jgi:threonyl-tRNA synthetase
MIHRAIYGSFERFIGILTEHYAGNFPLWLAPKQVIVMSVTNAQEDYATEIYEELKNNGIRTALDIRNEKISYKVREAENYKIPYMIIVGDKEKAEGNISVRQHKKGDIGKYALKNFIEMIKLEIYQKKF